MKQQDVMQVCCILHAACSSLDLSLTLARNMHTPSEYFLLHTHHLYFLNNAVISIAWRFVETSV